MRPDWERYLRPDWRERKYWADPRAVEHCAPRGAYLSPPRVSRASSSRTEPLRVSEEVAAAKRDLARLRRLAAELKYELAFRRLMRALKANFNPDQPRVPAGNPDGGQWTSLDGDAEGASVQSILAQAAQLAASGASLSRCIDLCSPLLERIQPPGSDRNQFDFRRCVNACLGRLGQ
jgi:hypothetical protein